MERLETNHPRQFYTYDVARLQRRRLELGWNYKELAVRAEVSPMSVKAAEESGEITPKLARKIAGAMGMVLDDIIVPVMGKRSTDADKPWDPSAISAASKEETIAS